MMKAKRPKSVDEERNKEDICILTKSVPEGANSISITGANRLRRAIR